MLLVAYMNVDSKATSRPGGDRWIGSCRCSPTKSDKELCCKLTHLT